MFKKGHVSRESAVHFSSKYLQKISWCLYPKVQFINFGATLINLFAFLFYTLSMKILQQVTS